MRNNIVLISVLAIAALVGASFVLPEMRAEVRLSSAVILLGGFGTWLLLPHRFGKIKPRVTHGIGAALAMLAVILLAGFYSPMGDFLQNTFFNIFATTAVASAILTVTSRDPVASALWFAGVILSSSGMFLLAGAQFLAAGTVIVYAGAIIVTFLFVIMLAQSQGMALYDRMSRAPGSATLSGFLLLWALYFALVTIRPSDNHSRDFIPSQLKPIALEPQKRAANGATLHGTLLADRGAGLVITRARSKTSQWVEVTDPGLPGKPPAHVAGLGGTLFADHLLAVELSGAILFVALIGAISIVTPKPPIRPSVDRATNAMGDPAQAKAMETIPI